MNPALKASPAPNVSMTFSGAKARCVTTISFFPAAAPSDPQAQTIMALERRRRLLQSLLNLSFLSYSIYILH